MNETVLGYILAIISSLFFTLYIIPKKLSKQEPMYYTMFLGIGFFIFALVFFLWYKILTPTTQETLFHPVLLLSALVGVLRAFASVLFLTAIDKLGLSRSNQWKNLQGPIGALLMLTFLSEFLTTNFIFIILAILFIFTSAILFTIRNEKEVVMDKTGIIYAIISALFFGTNAFIQKYVNNQGFIFAQQVYFSLFVFLSACGFLWIKKKPLHELKNFCKRDNLLAIAGGCIYFFAAIFNTFSYSLIPGSISFTIVQLNAVWTVLVGVFIFKEINRKQHRKQLLLGILFAILGVIALLYAQ